MGERHLRGAEDRRVLAVGSDDVGDDFLDELLTHVRGVLVQDLRLGTDRGHGYASIGRAVASAVVDGDAWRGLLVCGTGIGVAIAANGVVGARAAVCHESYSTERSVLSNNCQIICFGSRIIAVRYAESLLRAWLCFEFDPSGTSAVKVAELEGEGRRTASAPVRERTVADDGTGRPAE